MVRAEQDSLALKMGKAAAQNAVAGLLIHGDASFSGLGIVAECLQLSNVPGRIFTLSSSYPRQANKGHPYQC